MRLFSATMTTFSPSRRMDCVIEVVDFHTACEEALKWAHAEGGRLIAISEIKQQPALVA